MKNLLIKTTSQYSLADGTWKPSYRHTLHERINHKVSKFRFINILALGTDFRAGWTKADKFADYEFRCLENGRKPYHFTQEQFEQCMAEAADDLDCANRDAKFQAEYIY